MSTSNAIDHVVNADASLSEETQANPTVSVKGPDNTTKTFTTDNREMDRLIDVACGRIAPLWPLKHFVAVNPFFGLSDQTFQDASDTLARILGHGIYMSRDYYREQLASGRISQDDLQRASFRSHHQVNSACVFADLFFQESARE